MVLVVALASCKKTPEVNLKYVDVERDLVTVGTTTANIQCDYEYIATLKKAYFCYGEGETNMNSAEMRVVQNTLYVELTGLKANTTYSYYYEFHNGFNSMRTALKTFKTEAGNGGGNEPPTPEITLPTVITASVTEITENSAKGGGEVTNNGGAEVTERGICWSTNANPTLSDSHVAVGTGIGMFNATVSGLNESTTYHVRAYAINEKGTAYGLDVEFTTLSSGGTAQLPVVVTNEVTGITAHSASCGGEVISDDGAEVTERGICWSTNANPTITNSHVSAGTGTGTFSAMMSGLSANTTYHVRAYATNEAGTTYGSDKEFTTLEGGGSGNAPEGAINGLFTINESGDKVYFSQGNLQYIGSASTPYWKFADNQWDFFGETTGQNSANQNVDRDLFGWGTSGWDNGNLYYQPYDWDYIHPDTMWNAVDYGYGYGPTNGTNYNYDLTGQYANADWGVYNAISNGGNIPGIWRTLTKDEWNWVFFLRTTPSGIHFATGIVNDVNGVILLPDNWSTSVYALNYTDRVDAPFYTNEITAENWATMEANGAAFLPAAGGRHETAVGSYGAWGRYWSASENNSSYAWHVEFGDGDLGTEYTSNRYFGCSVRLVYPAEN